MDNNEISGEIPNRIQHSLPVLRELNFANQTQLSGTIPVGLSAISELRTLDLSNNKLNGTIPVVLGKSSLKALDLSNNELEGLVPPELASQLTLVVLSGNSL